MRNSRVELWVKISVLLYIFLFFAQLFSRRIVSMQRAGGVELSKYNIPFPFGWCSVMEWFMPLILCVGYLAVCKGYQDLWTILKGVMTVGLIEICCGEYGLKLYEFGLDEKVLFGSSTAYWYSVNPKMMAVFPWYYVGCMFGMLLLLQVAPKIISYMQTKGKLYLCTGVIYIACLNDGMLFNIYYYGEYTIYYVMRNLLLLFFLVCSCRKLPEINFRCDSRIKGNRICRMLIMFVVVFYIVRCLGLCIRNYEFYKSYTGNDSVYMIYIRKVLVYFCRDYMLILVAMISMYISNCKLFEKRMGMIATMYSATFLVTWYIRVCDIRNTRMLNLISVYKYRLAIWVIALFFLYRWLIGCSRKADKIFLTILYGLAIGGIIIEEIVIAGFNIYDVVHILMIIIYLIMYGITLLNRNNLADEKSVADDRDKNKVLWFCFLCYGIMTIHDCAGKCSIFYILKKTSNYSVTWNTQDSCTGLGILYALPFFFMTTYLGSALRKKNMKIFCGISTFATVFFLHMEGKYTFGEMVWYTGAPVCYLIISFLLLLYLYWNEVSKNSGKIVGRSCMIATYGVFVYRYVVPVVRDWNAFVNFEGERRWLPYIATQAILAILAVIDFVALGKETDVEAEGKIAIVEQGTDSN